MKGDLIAVLNDIRAELNGIRVELVRIQEAIQDTNPPLAKMYEKEKWEGNPNITQLMQGVTFTAKEILGEEQRPDFDSDNIPDNPQEPKIQLEK